MEILNNVSLKPFNTFGMDVKTTFFASIDEIEQLQDVANMHMFNSLPLILLGGGSNILFTSDFDGLVLKVNLPGLNNETLDNNKILVSAGAGENWNNLVQHCVNQGWAGLENLSLIPGSVGAAPIQNIGAYGVELKDVFSHLEAVSLQTFELHRFTLSDCNFGYRSSIFKNELKGRYLITSVSLILSLNPELNVTYPTLINEFKNTGETPSIKTVAEAVIRIRQSKLPDPQKLGNAGSFFKNPTVHYSKYDMLKSAFPSMPSFSFNESLVKIPAAWLIEQCGWKGKRFGDAGVHAFQPLVLVNYGSATGQQILELAEQIQESVKSKFEIELEPEVNVI